MDKRYLCRIQIYTIQIQCLLTPEKRFDMILMLGGLWAARFLRAALCDPAVGPRAAGEGKKQKNSAPAGGLAYK